jgi:hypothetical protein
MPGFDIIQAAAAGGQAILRGGGQLIGTVTGGISQLGTMVQSAILGGQIKQQPQAQAQQMTEEQVGAQIEAQRAGDSMNVIRSIMGTALSLNLANIFPDVGTFKESQRKAYLRGLAEYEQYEKEPVKALTSPLAITAYTIPISFGAGRVVGFLFGKAGMIAGKIGPTVIGEESVLAGRLLPAGTTAAQLAVAGGGAALTGYGVINTVQAIIGAYPMRAEIVTRPTGETYAVERGGVPEAAKVGGQQALMWIFGIRGAMSQEMFPAAKTAIRRKIYPEFVQERPSMPEWVTSLDRYPQVRGMNAKEKINWLFKNPQARSTGLPLELESGERLVVHATASIGGRREIWLEPLYVTPGELLSEPFLRLPGYKNISLIPTEMTLSGSPRAIMVYAEKGTVGKPTGRVVYGKTAAGYAVRYPAEAGPSTLWEPIKPKTEIEAILKAGAKYERVIPDELTAVQRLFLPLVGKTPYYYRVRGRAVPATLYKAVPGEAPVVTAKGITGQVEEGAVSVPYGGSSSEAVSRLFGSSAVSGRRGISGRKISGAGISGKPSVAPSAAVIRPPEYPYQPTALPEKLGPQAILPKYYKIKGQVDYYNELKRAWAQIFGEQLAPEWRSET